MIRKTGWLVLLIVVCSIVSSMAQGVSNSVVSTCVVNDIAEVQDYEDVDSINVPHAFVEQLCDTPSHLTISSGERVYRSQYFQMAYVGVPLVVAGVATQGAASMRFKELRDTYASDFDYPYDDYLQVVPGIAAVILKTCGVKGRSSWPRFIVSGAFSGVLTFGIVQGLKYSVGTLRPDGSTRNSFPSGHTATAFMAAHMLHKEYGNVSPWISVGGYTVATAVGISRILNNRHWISDVLAGAGIGILSVELGYFITDLIYKDKGLYRVDTPDFTIPEHPSYMGLTMGLSLPLASINVGDGQRLVATTGSRMGVEGAWYINRYVGVGATAAVSTLPTSIENNSDVTTSIDAVTMAAGVMGSMRMGDTSRFRVNMKALIGCNYMNNSQLLPEVMEIDPCGFYYELGLSLSVVARRHFGASVFCDYGGHCFSVEHTPSEILSMTRSGRYNYVLHTATLGISTSILF